MQEQNFSYVDFDHYAIGVCAEDIIHRETVS